MPTLTPYIILDGYQNTATNQFVPALYMVQQGSYTRNWKRQFTSNVAANIVRINYVDAGPGFMQWDMTLILASFPKYGINLTANQQLNNLAATYTSEYPSAPDAAAPVNPTSVIVTATDISYQDPLGNQYIHNSQYDTDTQTYYGGVFLTNLSIQIPEYSTPQSPVILATIELVQNLKGLAPII